MVHGDQPACDHAAVTVRTYKKRAGRVTATQADALARLWEAYGADVHDARPLDLAAWFGRRAPVVLEVGFGMGDATAALAAAQPDVDVLAVDVHTPGHGNLLALVERDGLTNVRLLSGDARTVLTDLLAADSLAGIRVFFPDPWPKARHAKRRLVSRSFLSLAASRLEPGGFLHLATDVEAYAEMVCHLVAQAPEFEPMTEVPWRPRTKFEQRAIRDGRPVTDLAYHRTGTA
jgi:tRNA (guanine-N7-)-methyltransferase